MSNQISAPLTIVTNTITAPITLGVGGSGASTFAALTDKATANLPTINTPLANALAAKLSTAAATSTYAPLTILQIEVTGSLTADGSQSVAPAAPLIYTGDGPDGGDRYYCTALGVIAEIKWNEGSGQWRFSISDPTAGDCEWFGTGTLATPLSEVAWFPLSPATGTPVMNFIGPIFPNAKPSNASVNTAIATNPGNSRTALGLGALATVNPGVGVATAAALAVNAAGGFFAQGGALSASTVTSIGAMSVTAAGTIASFVDSGTGRAWQFSSGNLTPLGNNQADLGGSATRIANGYFVGLDATTVTASGAVSAGSGTFAGTVLAGNSRIRASTEGLTIHGKGYFGWSSQDYGNSDDGTSMRFYKDTDAECHLKSSAGVFRSLKIANLTASGTVVFGTYTVGTVPSAATYVRGMIYVSNEAGGATLAYSNGTNWKRVYDAANIS